jgi:hypothetical protein
MWRNSRCARNAVATSLPPKWRLVGGATPGCKKYCADDGLLEPLCRALCSASHRVLPQSTKINRSPHRDIFSGGRFSGGRSMIAETSVSTAAVATRSCSWASHGSQSAIRLAQSANARAMQSTTVRIAEKARYARDAYQTTMRPTRPQAAAGAADPLAVCVHNSDGSKQQNFGFPGCRTCGVPRRAEQERSRVTFDGLDLLTPRRGNMRALELMLAADIIPPCLGAESVGGVVFTVRFRSHRGIHVHA